MLIFNCRTIYSIKWELHYVSSRQNCSFVLTHQIPLIVIWIFYTNSVPISTMVHFKWKFLDLQFKIVENTVKSTQLCKILKLSLLFSFGQVDAEIFGLEHNKY